MALIDDLIEQLAIEPNLVTHTFQFHAGHFLVNIERQVVGIMYRHLSAQGAFSDMSVRLFEILQKMRGQNILYLGKYCEGLKIPCL